MGGGEERYAALFEGCEGSKRNGKKSLRHHVELCKVRSVGTLVKRRDVVNGARGLRSCYSFFT